MLVLHYFLHRFISPGHSKLHFTSNTIRQLTSMDAESTMHASASLRQRQKNTRPFNPSSTLWMVLVYMLGWCLPFPSPFLPSLDRPSYSKVSTAVTTQAPWRRLNTKYIDRDSLQSRIEKMLATSNKKISGCFFLKKKGNNDSGR